MKAVMSMEYKTFFKEIKERIYKAQYDALKVVNKELINLYWDIGKSIVESKICLVGARRLLEHSPEEMINRIK